MIESLAKHIKKKGVPLNLVTLEEHLKNRGFTGSLISKEEYMRKYNLDSYLFNSYVELGIVLVPGNPNLNGSVLDISPITRSSHFEEIDLEEFIFRSNVDTVINFKMYPTIGGFDRDRARSIRNSIVKSLSSYKVKVSCSNGLYVLIPNCYKKKDVNREMKKVLGFTLE